MAVRKKKASKKKASRRTIGGVKVDKATLEAFEAPNGGQPIGEKGVVIGAKGSGSSSVFYYVVEENGKYFYHDKATGNLHELPTLPNAGQAIVRELTNRGALVADIDQEDTGGIGGYCYLLSVENLS
jgi:hypothetical protein